MKVLVVSRNTLEITRAQLQRPYLIIGRSPSCDVILRAPGVKPIHFLVEWVGGGSFDPNKGAWAIVDISNAAHDGAAESADGDSGEGQMLSGPPITVDGFNFSVIEDRLEAAEEIGGRIRESLVGSESDDAGDGGAELLELVQIRTDSGAVEEIRHLPLRKRRKKERALRGVPEFAIQWEGDAGASPLSVLLEEMPGAEIFNRGARVRSSGAAAIKAGDILQIQWNGREFFLRFVDRVKAPPIPRDISGGDRFLAYFMGLGLLLVLLFGAVAYFRPGVAPEEVKPPPRIARVEIAEVKPPPPPPPPPPPKEEVAPKKAEEAPKPKAQPKPAAPQPAKKPPGKAAAPRFKSAPGPVKMGINAPAKVTDVNAVGLLGALKKQGPAGKSVHADQIINDGIVTESVSGAENVKVVVRNPPAGVLGNGKGNGGGGDGPGLGAASTTLSGAGKYDPTSVGVVATRGGSGKLGVGTSLKGGGDGMGKGAGEGLDSDFTVEGGGLDRETVRKVIQSYRNEIRTCYEKALLSSPKLGGRIVYKWTISPGGPVVSVEKLRSDVGSDNLEACVLGVIKSMTFPRAENGRATRVIYPFIFHARKA